MGGAPSLLDLFKGTDLRRTIITCLIYASQNFAGNLIANQATYFFERKYSLLSPATQYIKQTHILTPNRSRNVPRPSLPTQPRQLLPPILRKYLLLVRNGMVRSSNSLPLGYSSKYRFASNSRNLRLNCPKQLNKLRSSLSRNSNFLRLRPNPRPNLLHHYRRNFICPSSCPKYRCRSRCILHRGNPHDLPLFPNAKYHRLEFGG